MKLTQDMDVIPKITPTPSGNIEGIFHGILSGWFISGSDKHTEELLLLHEGVLLMSATTGINRPDVSENLGIGGKSGFSFNLNSLDNPVTNNFRIIHKKTGFDFHGIQYSFHKEIEARKSVIEGIFSSEYYRYKYYLNELNALQAFQHYISKGVYENKDPSPYFSNEFYTNHYANLLENDEPAIISYLRNEKSLTVKPSERIDIHYYAAANPDIENVPSYLQHFSEHGAAEGRKPIKSIFPEFLKEEMEDQTLLEPAIITAFDNIHKIVRYPYIRGSTYLPRIIQRRYGNSIKAIVCVPFISRGGADLVSTLLLKAYQQAFGMDSVLLIITDRPIVEMPDWVGDSTLSFCMDDECNLMGMEDKVECLHNIVGLLAPEKFINVNSHVAWNLIQVYGMPMSSVIDLYAYLFCFDYDINGRHVGYIPGYVPSVLENMTGFFCDNNKIIDDMKEIYGFSNEVMSKFNPVYIPCADSFKTRKLAPQSKPDKILWIGRFARQKRPDVLVEIALSMPSIIFDVYGTVGDSPYADRIINGEFSNIHYKGVYSNIDEINLTNYRLFLNTSSWDGIPTILIQMMKLGIPIVTSRVGGISELVTEETGFTVTDILDISEYITQINRAFIMDELCQKRVENGIALINKRHVWKSFYSELERLGAFTIVNNSDRKTCLLKSATSEKSDSDHKVESISKNTPKKRHIGDILSSSNMAGN